MYGEFFDIPAPDELIFISSFSGGEVFRSGATFRRGNGKIFYFSPGDQDYPIYHHRDVQRVIANGVGWAAPATPAHSPARPLPVGDLLDGEHHWPEQRFPTVRTATSERLPHDSGRRASAACDRRRRGADGARVAGDAGCLGRRRRRGRRRPRSRRGAGALRTLGLPELPVATSITDLLTTTPADVVINVTVPVAHHAVSTEALRAGLPVLSEKPLTPTVAAGVSLAATAHRAGRALMVSQSRRYYRSIQPIARRGPLDSGGSAWSSPSSSGRPRFGGFRDEMAAPAARRHVDPPLRRVPVPRRRRAGLGRVRRVQSAVELVPRRCGCRRDLHDGAWHALRVHRIVVQPGTRDLVERRVARERGARHGAVGRRRHAHVGRRGDLAPADPATRPGRDRGSPRRVRALAAVGQSPEGRAETNIRSLAMVEAAIESARTGSRVLLGDVMQRGSRQCDRVRGGCRCGPTSHAVA